MKKFQVNTKDGKEITFKFPTDVKELTPEVLKEITYGVHVAENYSLIGLCYKEKLSNIIPVARGGRKDAKIKVTPIFVKAGDTDVRFINNLKGGDKIIATQSEVARGIHVSIPGNILTLEYFTKVIVNCADKDIYERELANPNQEECIFIEFKLLPNCDILGTIEDTIPAVFNIFCENKSSKC